MDFGHTDHRHQGIAAYPGHVRCGEQSTSQSNARAGQKGNDPLLRKVHKLYIGCLGVLHRVVARAASLYFISSCGDRSSATPEGFDGGLAATAASRVVSLLSVSTVDSPLMGWVPIHDQHQISTSPKVRLVSSYALVRVLACGKLVR